MWYDYLSSYAIYILSTLYDLIFVDQVFECIGNLFFLGALIILEYWPFYFKSANTVIIPKPNKMLHNILSSFWPIVLLNTTSKLVEKVISNRLQFHMTANGFLDPNQLEGIRQRSTTNAGIYLTHLICARWLRQYHTCQRLKSDDRN